MSKVKKFMENIDVSFVSLVNKGANNKKFAIFKSAEQDQEQENGEKNESADEKSTPDNSSNESESSSVEKAGEEGKQPVKKYYYDSSFGSSFKAAVNAVNTQEALYEAQDKVDECFYILRSVINGVIVDDDVKNKSAGLKQVISEFSEYVTGLFDDISKIEKSEADNTQGGQVSKQSVKKEDAGISNNGIPTVAKTKAATVGDINGISGKAELKKSILQKSLDSATKQFEEAFLSQDEEAENKAYADIERITKSIEAIEKSVGDGSEGAPATGEDTVATNGSDTEKSNDPTGETGDTSGAIAKSATTESEEAAASTTTTENESSESGEEAKPVAKSDSNSDLINQLRTVMSEEIEKSTKTLETKFSEQLSSVKKEFNSKIEKSEEKTDQLASMGGLSHSLSSDYEQSKEELEKEADMQKSEDEVFANATDLNGLSRK